jgi:pSer/pThr/pTyr-binding forkhead associated (FHA) protein
MMIQVWIRDPARGRLIIRTFHRSPVTVGHSPENVLRLRGAGISSHHGAFLFDDGVLSYIDFGSASGTTVDGARVAADRDVEVASDALLAIGPFQLQARLTSADVSSW